MKQNEKFIPETTRKTSAELNEEVSESSVKPEVESSRKEIISPSEKLEAITLSEIKQMPDEQLRELLINASIQEQLKGNVQAYIAELSTEQIRLLFSSEKMDVLRAELKESLNNLLSELEAENLEKDSNLENNRAFINLTNVSRYLVIYFLAQKAMPQPDHSPGESMDVFKQIEAELSSISKFKHLGFNVYDLFK